MSFRTYDHWKTTEPPEQGEGEDCPDRCPDCGSDGLCAPGCPARLADCTCRMESVNSASIDPPELILNPWCPVHGGRDPDEELQRRRDEPDDDRDIPEDF
jgi:hypothetical protein